MTTQTGGPSIKHKILHGFILLLVFPLAIVTAFAYWQSARMIEQKSLRQFSTVTGMASQQFDQYFQEIEFLSINVLRNDLIQQTLRQPYVPPTQWTLRQIDEEKAVQRFLGGIYELKPGISSILLYGYNGMNYHYHPTRTWNHNLEGFRDPFYQKALLSGGRWVLSGRREERQLTSIVQPDPELVVTFGRLIRDLDTLQPLGVLFVNVRLDMLQSLAEVKDSGSHLVILDDEGNPVISSSPDAERVTAGSDLLRVSTVAPFTKWTSVYMAPRGELFRESRQIRNFIIGVTVISLGAALILANFISAGIVKPLGDLRLRMKRVESGELDFEITPVSHDEVGELTRGFNRMVQRLGELLDEVRQQEQKRTAVELQAMQARINPHFMYNTLNGIRWVAMMEGNRKVADMVASLVHLLQFSARNTAPLISVRKELDLLEHYLQLMKMRNDTFDYQIQADDEVLDGCIIPFLLQPIVENAIFHGIIPLKARGAVTIWVTRQNGTVYALVEDNGVGMDEEAVSALLSRDNREHGEETSTHIGLNNVSSRLKLQFGSRAELSVKSELGRGTAVSMAWPLQHCGEGSERD